MRLERLGGEEAGREVGAAVVRAVGAREIVLELGPADGPPLVRLTMSHTEAMRLTSAAQTVVQSGGESILIVDD
ncbi:MAG: hypothetical protein QOF01_1971 [Thermomicrobiales bacterium]|jgi:hypothetical protein|nr:hypothetical protein [Thermomicrobiales bacterium]MEA2595502.1 hypothetical protein [Thermomicrobiales bacterium]